MKNGKNLALIGAAAVIAYLIYLYEKKKTAVASQITGFQATSTPTGVPITNSIVVPTITDSIVVPTIPVLAGGFGPVPAAPAGSAPLPNYYSNVPNPYPAPYQIAGAYGSYVPGFSGAD